MSAASAKLLMGDLSGWSQAKRCAMKPPLE